VYTHTPAQAETPFLFIYTHEGIHMKKAIALIAIMTASLSLSACNFGSASETDDTTTQEAAAVEQTVEQVVAEIDATEESATTPGTANEDGDTNPE
jgi:hypothetical protein